MNFGKLFATTVLLLASSAAAALPVVFNGTIPAGTAQFDSTIAAVNGTLWTDTLSGLANGNTWARNGYTISSTNGNFRAVENYCSNGYCMSGQAFRIDPNDPAEQSGITFTFSQPINAFGLEIGDWATCCYLPSNLYISFDGGATRLAASAFSDADNPGNAAGLGFLNFIGAIDDSATFSTITFYGDGFGEWLYAGGTIRFGRVDIGSVSVPEPAVLGLMGLGLLGMSFKRRKSA